MTKQFRNITKQECSICFISEWQGKKLTLELDHIDGNNLNNDFVNLRLLCPNCHSQTKTWRGRNKNSGKLKVSDEELIEAVSNTSNIRQALISVGLTPKGMNYSRVSNLIHKSEVDFKNSQYGTLWMNNGIENKKVKKDHIDDYTSCGYVLGRIPLNFSTPSVKGKIWVTNGIENKMVSPDSIPSGFWKGKFHKK
jgi:hypothetical protein